MAEAGADIIELGIPFSDPTAEGPVIQEANIRALKNGITTDKVFDMVKEIRKDWLDNMFFSTRFEGIQTMLSENGKPITVPTLRNIMANVNFDDLAVKTIKKSAPFAKLPKNVDTDVVDFEFRFEFYHPEKE